MLQRGSAFKGYTIEATDGKVGTISDLLFDDQKWQLRWLVVDTGNWLNGRKVLIHPAALERPDSAGRAFVSKLTRAQLEASPAIDTDAPVAMQMERNMGGYYGWSATYYDNGIAASPVLPMPPHGAEPRTEPGDAGPGPIDRHLRSIAEVSRYAIHALDGNVGHFETFLVDDESWAIRYLVIDTMDWWMGKHVLVSPSSVTNIDWAQRQISLDLTCYKIKGSPAWDDTGPIDRVYEQVLRLYYGWGALGDDTGAVTHVPVAAA
jgi:hypothetical protein